MRVCCLCQDDQSGGMSHFPLNILDISYHPLQIANILCHAGLTGRLWRFIRQRQSSGWPGIEREACIFAGHFRLVLSFCILELLPWRSLGLSFPQSIVECGRSMHRSRESQVMASHAASESV